MAFSRMNFAKAKAAPVEDPEEAAWQAQVEREKAQEEQNRPAPDAPKAFGWKKAAPQAAAPASDKQMEAQFVANTAEDARWKAAQAKHAENLADCAATMASDAQMDEEKARQLRIERSKAEAAKRAGGEDLGSLPKGASGSGSGFAWKKPTAAAPASSTGLLGRPSGTAKSTAHSGDLPSHDDCEMAVSAIISRTQTGMKEGLRQMGLPDYPLKFIPGRELELCGHNIREVFNEMIHAWMTEEKDEFYNVLLRIKNLVGKPQQTEDQMTLDSLAQEQDAAGYAGPAEQPPSAPADQAAKPKAVAAVVDDDSEDEVIDVSSAPPAKQEPAPPAQQHTFAKPAPSASAGPVDGEDHYKLLGLETNATLQEIRMKFRQLVVTEHPEKGGDPKKFAKLNKAYATLSDSEKRKQYDDQRAG